MSNLAQLKAEQSKATEMAESHVEAYSRTYTPKAAIAAWLGDAQTNAREQFKELGFPTTRPEMWRFTNLAPLARQTFSAPQKRPVNSAFIGEVKMVQGATTLVFLDGTLHPDLSELAHLPSGVTVAPLAQSAGLLTAERGEMVKQKDQPLEALNAAYLTGGYILEVKDGTDTNTPIELVFLTTGEGEATHTRNFIKIGNNASLDLYETWAGTSGAQNCWQNNVCHINVGQNSRLNFTRSQDENAGNFFTSSVYSTLQKDAVLNGFMANKGGKTARTHFTTDLKASGSHVGLYGFSLVGAGQHHNVSTTTNHSVPHTTADQCFRNVVAADATRGGHAVFIGQYNVAAEAQKTDAGMLNQNLLLGEKAKADYKPELEIFADDVKCSHGATTGRLDAEQLFYLRTRGLSTLDAKAMLTEAFVASLIDKISSEQAQTKLKTQARNWLKNQKNLQEA